jgi:hypothetical protein
MGSQREQKLFDYSHQTVSNYSPKFIKPSLILDKEKTPKALKQGIASRMGSHREQKLFAMAHQTVSNYSQAHQTVSNSRKRKNTKALEARNSKPHGSCTLYSVL